MSCQPLYNFFVDGFTARNGRITREEWAEAFLADWNEAVTYLAPLLKHDAFRDEKEWRLIRRFGDADIPRMQFVQRQQVLSRHLPLEFAVPDGSVAPLPIAAITVGPSRHKQISLIGVGDLLRKSGYAPREVELKLSGVPYQTL